MNNENNEECEIYEGGKRNKIKHKLLGEGSYGCIWKPGINCSGKNLKNKKQITKIVEIDFLSKNEIHIGYSIKKIKGYNKRFGAVKNFCIVEFNTLINSKKLDINDCKKLINKIEYNNSAIEKLLENKFFIFYIKYIGKRSLYEELRNNNIIENNKRYCAKYIHSLYFLLNSIQLLINKKIVHNDLHLNNIMYNMDRQTPIIIDFGLGFDKNNFNNSYNKFNYSIIHEILMDYRIDINRNAVYNIEKRFITYFIYNRTDKFNNVVYDDLKKNELSKKNIELFIEDTYDSMEHNYKEILLTELELKEYKKSLYNYLIKFENKEKYPYYSSILSEIFPIAYKFIDIYSISINYIELYNENYITLKSSKFSFIYDIIINLLKKVLFPEPKLRLECYQLISILGFIIKYINNIKEYTENIEDDFNTRLKILLNEIDVKSEVIFNRNYAYIDFSKILTKENIELVKSLKIKIKSK